MYKVYILLCVCLVTSMAVPTYRVIISADDKLVKRAKDWLQKYGYLEASTDEDDFREAILKMRSFHGLFSTDKIDSEMIRIMSMPRCGVPDTVGGVMSFGSGDLAAHQETRWEDSHGRYKRFKLANSKWDTARDVTYGFHNFSSDLSPEEQRETFSRAINEWSAVANINFKEVSNAAESDIEVLFASGSHGDDDAFDGRGKTLAHAFFPGHPKFGGDLHFDKDETFSTTEREGAIDLYHISLHELGHSLGIDHSSVADAIMFPVYRGFDDQIRLARDDIVAIQSLYGVRYGYQLPPDIENGQVVVEVANSGRSTCSITYDAIVRTKSHIYFFQGDRTWQTDLNFKPENHASKIKSLWQGGPNSVDAAFTKEDNSTVLLSGDSRWEYFPNSFTLKPDFPKTNDDIGIPTSVDAAVYIAVFNSIIIFKGDLYWTLDRDNLHVRASEVDAANFAVPKSINAAFSTDDKVYFLTGDTDFFLFEASPFQPVIGYPKDFSKEIANELCEWCNAFGDDDEGVNDDSGANRSIISWVFSLAWTMCYTFILVREAI